MGNLKKIILGTDLVLVTACAICSSISVYALYSIYMTTSALSSPKTAMVQLGASLVGIFGAFIISFVDYRDLTEYHNWHTAFAYGLMVLTMFIGFAPPGTTNKAWIQLPLGLTVQPSEFLKLSMIITLAFFLDKYKNQINEVRVLIKLAFIAAIPFVFVAIQKDGGTLIIFTVIIAGMFFAAGISMKLVIAVLASGVIVAPIMWFYFLEDYQLNRIRGLFNPEKYANIMWQQIMGEISIGSGRIFGKGFMSVEHNNTPLMYNDFIFSFLAESLGFVFTILLLCLILFICLKIILIATSAQDLAGSYICVGVFTMMITQTIINIGMNLSLLPVIGITLPLFTAGGTSVVATYCAIGLVLSVSRHNKKNLF